MYNSITNCTMYGYIEINKELAQEVKSLRQVLHEYKMELIEFKKKYFQEHAAKLLLKQKFQRVLEELQVACTEKFSMKIMQILQKYKEHDDCNDSDSDCNNSIERSNNRSSSIKGTVSLHDFSDMLQEDIHDAAPPRISNAYYCDSDSINNTDGNTREVGQECAANASSNNYVEQAEMSNLFDHINDMVSVEVKEQRLNNRRTTMASIHETNESDNAECRNTSDEAIKSMCQLKKRDNCMKSPEINIELYENKDKQPETTESIQQTSKIDVQSRYAYVTERRHKTISQPKVAHLIVSSPSSSSLSLKDLNSPVFTSPEFHSSAISYGTSSLFSDSQEYNGTATATTTMATTRRAVLQEINQNNMTSRPRRRCKPTNLKEPDPLQGYSQTKHGRKKKINKTDMK